MVFAGSVGAASNKPIIFADMSWDSIMVHNRIVAFIIGHGMGYESEFVPGSTPVMVKAMMLGDVDVDMESWTQNVQEVYDEAIASGRVIDLGPNYPDSWQGWLVPTYVIKGDPERGIEPMAPDLRSVADLPRYRELFRDPENPDMGRFYNAIAGWQATAFNERKLAAYGLDKHFTSFVAGSDAALSGSMLRAYERGKPWFGYYWGPTWVLGMLDMTPLEEPAYDAKTWDESAACAFPSVEVNKLVTTDLAERAPEVVELLRRYTTTLALNNEFLAYMKQNKATAEDTAKWFLREHRDLWTGWVSPEVARKVEAAL